ncbi:protein of unknown function [Pseudomonas sp. JV551A1]|nr:protein of unknown function [Pseudomonas sp. JV551A1]
MAILVELTQATSMASDWRWMRTRNEVIDLYPLVVFVVAPQVKARAHHVASIRSYHSCDVAKHCKLRGSAGLYFLLVGAGIAVGSE